ncbi:hypothetical protein K504DRAFT_445677 [Pleomassaria siparia CBS 279.74]|uniref:Uncharacterized protein n=1 Tax=Pleomassaria siparia CBS 279.74 TaxID=1314801 RepID=A0A6G1KQG1_9PLEO|nr:hypothetical protein K504DRAFT_445677 [Pleomassaria siparia CBS 279.74]
MTVERAGGGASSGNVKDIDGGSMCWKSERREGERKAVVWYEVAIDPRYAANSNRDLLHRRPVNMTLNKVKEKDGKSSEEARLFFLGFPCNGTSHGQTTARLTRIDPWPRLEASPQDPNCSPKGDEWPLRVNASKKLPLPLLTGHDAHAGQERKECCVEKQGTPSPSPWPWPIRVVGEDECYSTVCTGSRRLLVRARSGAVFLVLLYKDLPPVFHNQWIRPAQVSLVTGLFRLLNVELDLQAFGVFCTSNVCRKRMAGVGRWWHDRNEGQDKKKVSVGAPLSN